MRVSAVAVLMCVLVPAAGRTAGVEVRIVDGRVDLTSDGAPLGTLLDRLSQALSFQLERDGNVPNPIVPALELRGRTPVEAVLSVLEGLGLNHALTLDVSGARIEKLVLVGASSSARGASGGARPTPFSRRNAPRPELYASEPEPDPGSAGLDESEILAPDAGPAEEPPPEASPEPETPKTDQQEGAFAGARLVTPGAGAVEPPSAAPPAENP
jgi:hypothetical protein